MNIVAVFFLLFLFISTGRLHTRNLKKKHLNTKEFKEKNVLCGQPKKYNTQDVVVSFFWPVPKRNAIKCKQEMYGQNLCHFAKRCIRLTRDFSIEHSNFLLNETERRKSYEK